MTGQRAIEIMEGHGLDPWRYGFICRDEIPKGVKVMHRDRASTDEIEEAYSEIEIRHGVPIQVEKTRTVQGPRVEKIAVVDTAGEPVRRETRRRLVLSRVMVLDAGAGEDLEIVEQVPVKPPLSVVIEVEREVDQEVPDSDRLGFRYNQPAMFILAGLATRRNDHPIGSRPLCSAMKVCRSIAPICVFSWLSWEAPR